MGLTHYWTRKLVYPEGRYRAACAGLSKLLACAASDGLRITRDDSTGASPLVDPGAGLIHFNGHGEDGAEPFVFERNRELQSWETEGAEGGSVEDFCKTYDRPYDLVVRAALLILATYLGEGGGLVITSDDSWATWLPAVALARRAGVHIPPTTLATVRASIERG